MKKNRQLRSRIVQTLNVPQGYASESSLAAALLDGLFEQPAGIKDQCGMPKDPELSYAQRLFVWVLGSELDDDRVIPLPRGLKVHIISQAPDINYTTVLRPPNLPQKYPVRTLPICQVQNSIRELI